MTKIFTTALILLILITSVSAFEEDFFASAPKELNVCQCATLTNPITIRNSNVPDQQTTFTIIDGSTDTDVILNAIPSTYTFKQSGKAAKWSTILPSILTLETGETQLVEGLVTAPCDAKGSFNLETTIDTQLGLSKEFTQKVNVQECNNIDVEAIKSSVSGCPCSTLKYEFTITNSGSFLETYAIGASNNVVEYISLSENVLVLVPGESKTVFAYYNGPCELNGEVDFDLLVEARSTDTVKKLTMEAEIAPCYSFDVSTGDLTHYYEDYTEFTAFDGTYNVCEKEPAGRIPIRITNTADITNDYTFDLMGPDWAKLSHTSAFGLEKGDVAEFFITLNPYANLNEYVEFELSVETEIGNLEQVYNIPVASNLCFPLRLFPEIERFGVNYSIISTLLDVKNDGNTEETYDISIDIDWGEVSPAELTVGSNETVYFELITYPNNLSSSGTYEATVTAVSQTNGVEYSKEISIKLSEGGLFQRINALLGGYLIYLIIGLVLLFLLIILLGIFGKRKPSEEPEEYQEPKTEAELKAEKKAEKAQRKAERFERRAIRAEKKAEKAEMTAIGEQKPASSIWKWIFLLVILLLLILGIWWAFGYFGVGDTLGNLFTGSNETTTTPEGGIEETVVEEPIVEEPIVEKPIEEPEEEGESALSRFFSQITSFINVYLWYILIGILLAIIIIVVLSFTGKKEPTEEKSVVEKKDKKVKKAKVEKAKKKVVQKEEPRRLWWLAVSLILLAIILLIAGFFGYSWYSDRGGNESVVEDTEEFVGVDCLKKWPKNTPSTVNLSVGFSDPDGDPLTFTSTEPENAVVEIDDRGIATVTPDRDYTGVIDITFFADDGRGFKVPTGSLNLCISNEEIDPLSKTWDYVNRNRTYFIIGVFLLIIVVMLILFNKPIIRFLEEDEQPRKR